MSEVTAQGGASEPEAADHPGRRLGRAMIILLVGYLALVLVLIVVRGAYVTPDLFLILAAVVAVGLGRTRLFLRDWLPFIAILLAWQSMRSLADNLGFTVHSDDIIAMERALFFGKVPSVELQAWLHQPGSVNAIDLFTAFLYVAHFALPLTVALFFWVVRRPLYYRYITALMVMSFAAFVVFILFPVAPPRFSGAYGEALPVRDLLNDTFTSLQFAPVTTWLYANISGNDVAAMPSLHSAYPLLAYLFAREVWRRASLILLVYSAAVWFSVVYLGHHYVVDVIGGILFALGAYAVLQTPVLRRVATWLANVGQRARSVLPRRPRG